MKKYLDKTGLQEFTAKLTAKFKTVFALKGETATDAQVAEAVTDWLDTNVNPVGSAVVVDSTLSITGAAADAKKTGDEVSDLKNAFLFTVSNKIKVDQGYWAIADGTPTNSMTWCRTTNFVNKDAILKSNAIKMYLLAYDVSGNYIGTWNGNTFSTVYASDKYLNEIVFLDWVDAYPNYCFKVDFYKGGNSVVPADVIADLSIESYIYPQAQFIERSSFEADITGQRKVNPTHFTNGTLTLGELYPSYKYRVSMREIKSFPYDVHLIANTGFRLSINLFSNGEYTGYAGWTSDYIIPANQQFRIMIARTTDNTSEVADVAEFVNNIYFKSLSLKNADAIDAIEFDGNLVNALTSGFRYIYHFGMGSVTERTVDPPVIPSQSIYDVRSAKNLGFACIEANVHKTSDGHYIVTHGVDGKLGHDFDDLNGNDAGDQNIVISQNTLSYLQTNFRYRSSNPDYRLPITTLEDFLAECSRVDIKVMQMYCDDTSMNIGINIMGGHRIFFYSAPRSSYKGPITNWRKLTTKAAIVADCESFGVPYIYSMGNPSDFTDNELKDIAQTLHSMGYQLMTAYRTNSEINKLASFGWDYFILGDNTYREPVIINGKQLSFNQDGSITWTLATP